MLYLLFFWVNSRFLLLLLLVGRLNLSGEEEVVLVLLRLSVIDRAPHFIVAIVDLLLNILELLVNIVLFHHLGSTLAIREDVVLRDQDVLALRPIAVVASLLAVFHQLHDFSFFLDFELRQLLLEFLVNFEVLLLLVFNVIDNAFSSLDLKFEVALNPLFFDPLLFIFEILEFGELQAYSDVLRLLALLDELDVSQEVFDGDLGVTVLQP